MPRTTLQVNFGLRMSIEEYQALCAAAAPAIAQVPGLQWKLFTLGGADGTAAGLYLFNDRPSARAYAAGPILSGLREHPGVVDLSIRMMDVDEDLSKITGAAADQSTGVSR